MTAPTADVPAPSPTARTAARLACGLGLAAALLLLVAGPGHRFGLWSFGTGFVLLRWAAYGGIAAMVLGALALLLGRRRGPVGLALAGLLLGAVAFAIPYIGARQARRVPPIHDITTDTENPPRFLAVLSKRVGAKNPVSYGGEEIARQQRAAYPDIVPYVAPVAPGAAFHDALEAARALGWTIVAADSADGRIEATARTRWFGFYDDVVIRVTPTASGARVDARSLSRVGKSDVGANARRLRRFFGRLRAQGFQAMAPA
ncbi:MAG TPA: DUF1499 domain-containing protein [Gemmatimonadales bacterium]|nr:DUF1499 domain-containing protein [Gemmatimonadales bacterium]